MKEKQINRLATKRWKEWQEKISEVRIPKNLLLLLTSTSKKQQVSLLNELSVSHNQLAALIIKAWTDYKFTYSIYSSESLPSDIKKSDLPMFFSAEKDKKVKVVGNTPLTKGKLKQVIEHRHNIIAKFLDCGNNWHCFFYTYKSLAGGEKSGVRHCHYISNAFGKTREEVLEQIKSDRYNLSSAPHLKIVGK